MNVIFLDFDGVINSHHNASKLFREEKIKLLSEICKKYDCKVVIEAGAKNAIDYETLETKSIRIIRIFSLFRKYGIECIGRTPTVERRITYNCYLPIWKEDEIRLYLFLHPEIDHYVVIDDDDRKDMHQKSDLDKIRKHLVKTEMYVKNYPEEEGLLERHIEEVGEKLKLENEIQKFAIRREENIKRLLLEKKI